MRWEIQIQRRKSDGLHDWDAMGMKPPKGETFFRKCLVDTCDVEFIEELTKDLCLLKCTWMESAVTVKGNYEEMKSRLELTEQATEEDLEI